VPKSNAQRYLDVFIEIEKALEVMVNSKSHRPFYQLVDLAAKENPFVKDIAVELKEYADLRNALVHERIDNEIIAEPHLKVVQRLEAINSLLRRPPKVEDAFLGLVVTCQSTDLLGTVIHKMYQHSFSKIPVYDGGRFMGLLTAEGITHWLAVQMANGSVPVNERVKEVIRYVKQNKNYAFVARGCSVFEVLEMFERYSHKGLRLQAVLITEDGREDRKPLGIITAFDLPKIYTLIEQNSLLGVG
jgi:predicted transcriptional regulator